MKIAVVIPCYNVAQHIDDVVKALPQNISHIIAVNDCSKDDTEKKLTCLAQQNERVIYIKHEVNQGVGGAMRTGFRKAIELNCDITIKMDGDDQMDSTNISSLIKPIVEGKADFTKGNRFRDFRALRKMPLSRRIGNLGLSFLI